MSAVIVMVYLRLFHTVGCNRMGVGMPERVSRVRYSSPPIASFNAVLQLIELTGPPALLESPTVRIGGIRIAG